jgi:hypothetical protein
MDSKAGEGTQKVKDVLQISNVYPRWLGFGDISYSQGYGQKPKMINTLFNLGDSELEVEMGVAQGFPNHTLTPYDIMIPESFAEYLGWTKEQPYILMTFDILKMFLDSEENRELANFVFADDSKNLNDKRLGQDHREPTKGEKILKIFGLPLDITFGQLVQKNKELQQFNKIFEDQFSIH